MIKPDSNRCETQPNQSTYPQCVDKGAGSTFAEDLLILRELVAECEFDIQTGNKLRLPGNAAFLSDGRVLCRNRNIGDSRYVYDNNGLNFWVSASGLMRANKGLFFIFLNPSSAHEPAVSFFAGQRSHGENLYQSHSLMPIPYLSRGESHVIDRYTVIGHDSTYFVSQTDSLFCAVRVFLDESDHGGQRICFSVITENISKEPLEIFTSTYMNPFCRHRYFETVEDRWYKKVCVENSNRHMANDSDCELPSFLIQTVENDRRDHSRNNYASVRRVYSLYHSTSGNPISTTVTSKTGQRDILENPEAVILEDQVCTSRTNFVGSPRHNLNSAHFLETGYFAEQRSVTTFNDEAIIGDLLNLRLQPEASFRTDYTFALPANEADIGTELRGLQSTSLIDLSHRQLFAKQQSRDQEFMRFRNSHLEEIDHDSFNRFLPYLRRQVEVCATTKGYLAPSGNSMLGIRDIFQAIEGHLYTNPEEARAKILEAMGFVLEDGRCPRQYSLPVNNNPGEVDLREFVDQGVWVISTVYRYLSVTGDDSLLDEVVGYHQISPVKNHLIQPSSQQDTVLEHLLRITEYLSRNCDEKTGLVRALYGDWNDALDGLGVSGDADKQFGSGVSVMVSLQFYQNCKEMLEILIRSNSANEYCEFIDRLQLMQKQLCDGLMKNAVVRKGSSRRIVHGWGDRRGYYVGSYCDSDGLERDGLTSNAFWILSGMMDHDPSLRDDLLAAFNRLDSPYGMKTFEPGFQPGTPGVGRISDLPLGTAENGAVYIHATTFAIAALFEIGEPQKAWEQIAKILPFVEHNSQISHSPFVMPNSYLVNSELNLTGQSMNDWQTGCSNVLLKSLIRYVCGFQPTMEGLVVSPSSWIPFDGYEFFGMAHQRPIHIAMKREKTTERYFTLNGNAISDSQFNQETKVYSALIPYCFLSSDSVNEIVVHEPLLHEEKSIHFRVDLPESGLQQPNFGVPTGTNSIYNSPEGKITE